DFDRAESRPRNLCREGERVVERRDVDEVVAAELLLRLGEWPVGGELLTVADTDGRGGRRRLKRIAGHEHALVLQLLRESAVLGEHLVALLIGHRPAPLLVAVDEKHVIHVASLYVGAGLPSSLE